MKRILTVAALAVVLTGCAWRTQVNRAMISTYKMNLDRSYEVDRTRTITGADRAHGIWLIPLGSPDAQDAVNKTIAEANRRSLLRRKIVGIADAEVKFRFLWLWLYSQRWYSVEGHPIYEK